LVVMFILLLELDKISWGRGSKMDVIPFYRNWRENETTWHWQLKPKRTAAGCGIARFPCGNTAFLFILAITFYCHQNNHVASPSE